jgi:hypothetical protein
MGRVDSLLGVIDIGAVVTDISIDEIDHRRLSRDPADKLRDGD